VVGASPVSAPAIVRLDVRGGTCSELRSPAERSIAPALVSTPRPFACPSAGGRVTHGLHYPPTNPDWTGPAGSCPPCIVRAHGGPPPSRSAAPEPALPVSASRGFPGLDADSARSNR